MTMELWAFRAEVRDEGADLRGMEVQAVDGGIGKVHDVVDLGSRAFLLVDTGPWIFGRTIKLPAGLVSAVDAEQGTVVVDCPKEQIKSAPEQDDGAMEGDAYDDALARHYAGPTPADEAPAAPYSRRGHAGGFDSPDDHEPRAVEPLLDPPLGASAGLTVDTRPAARRDSRESAPISSESAPAMSESAPAVSESAPASPESAPDVSESARASQEPALGSPGPAPGAGALEPHAASTTPPESRPASQSSSTPPARETSRAADGAAPAPASETTLRAREGTRPDTRDKDKPAGDRAPRRAKPRSPERATPAPAGRRRQTSSKQTSSSRRATRPEGQSPDGRAKTSSNRMPLPRYDSLTAAEVTARLRTLSQGDLAQLERYEKRGQSRQTILKRVSSLREKEPWRGYDSATVKEIQEKLTKADADRLTAVRDYERRHRDRTGVMGAVRRRIADK